MTKRHGVDRELVHDINCAAEAVDALVAVANHDRRQLRFGRDRDQHRVEVLRLVEQQIIEITYDPVPEFQRFQIGVMGDRQVVLFATRLATTYLSDIGVVGGLLPAFADIN